MPSTRRDAVRNRDRLIAAARDVLARSGPSAPLDSIAGAAGVSRTTLHRHFAGRDELVAAVLEQNVADIEARAAELAGAEDGAESLFHYMLDTQWHAPWLARVVTADTIPVAALARRIVAALEPLLEGGRARGRVRDDIAVGDVLLAMPMAMATQLAEAHPAGPGGLDRTRRLLHRALFTTEWDS